MAQTKEEIAADRQRLLEENARLRAQLTAAGRSPVAAPEHTFMLSEGDRQDLELHGGVSIGGRYMTAAEVRAAMAEADVQHGVPISEPEVAPAGQPAPAKPANVRGFDYVYPSVAHGYIDPAVAGTPGINGPAYSDDLTDVYAEPDGE